MRFIVILLVSVIGHSIADVLQVKCGDETCERPSNRAVTTLRYTPDKPYKLQINAVNSEVEIFGATDDLYYIRHGRNFGFLPKNHLREKARGTFPHTVEINLSSLQINQEVRERNFLHEFLKSSQDIKDVKDVKDVSNETAPTAPEQAKEEEKVIERPTEYIPTGIEPTIQEQPTNSSSEVEKKEENLNSDVENDSGLEDDEDEEESSGDEEEDEEEEEIVDSPKTSETSEQKIENIEVKPATYELPEEILNTTEAIQQEVQNEIPTEAPQPEIQNEIVQEQDVLVKDTIESAQNESEIVDNSNELKVEPEEIKIVSEPAPVTEEINEGVPLVNEAKEPELPQEIIQEVQQNVPQEIVQEVTQELPQEIPETTQIPPFDPLLPPEIVTEQILVEPEIETTTIPMEIVTEIPIIEETTQPFIEEIKTIPPPTEDMLLKRFDEKLSHKTHDHDGVGSVEQIVPPHQHSHFGHSHGDHGHSHGDHGHSHGDYGHSHDSHGHHSHLVDSHSHENHQHLDSHERTDHSHQHHDKEEPAVVENLVEEEKKGFLGGLFKTIFGDKKESVENVREDEQPSSLNVDEGFCEKIDSENCPKSLRAKQHYTKEENYPNLEQYLNMFLNEALQKMDLIISLGLTALTTLIFVFGYYCINRAKKEGPLIAKVNEMERHLMASSKENEMLKGEIINTKQKLTSIEDNSFGSNDMVIALKKELEESEQIKAELNEKISSLEKELEAAAEDGLELNKMVSELLNNQNGSESIISSVEDLQIQLNEQQDTIISMNEALAAKSRENTELQIQLAEFNNKTLKDIETYQQEIDALALERSNLQVELENLKRESDMQVNQLIEERNSEVTRLNNELTSYAAKFEETKKLLNTSEARVQALEECVEAMKKSKGGDFKNILDVADLKADLLAVTKEKSTLQDQLQSERDARKLLEDRVKTISDETSSLKKEFGVAEKEKLEAQTRLDVLSAYFKETEMRLQLELSEEKARAMKQQGETMSTVEKVQALNDEIQSLKSQNDSLRAEIEAQVAAHKLNVSSIEAQAHSAWLNARQAERKLEEARMESAALRRRLTSIAENPNQTTDLMNGLPPVMGNDSLNNVPSPMRVESPNMTSMQQQAGMPTQPPPMMIPPPFLPPGFLPPPFLPPGEMGPGPMLPPLGRLMSPPPKRFTPTMRDERDRYSPRRGGRYSPDSRYDDYTAFETETDYSPPPSPRRGYNSPSDRSKKSKGKETSSNRWSSTSSSSSQFSDEIDDW